MEAGGIYYILFAVFSVFINASNSKSRNLINLITFDCLIVIRNIYFDLIDDNIDSNSEFNLISSFIVFLIY